MGTSFDVHKIWHVTKQWQSNKNPHEVHLACCDDGLTGRTFAAMVRQYASKSLAMVAQPEPSIRF